MTFILNESDIESAQIQAAEDFHRPIAQQAALTLGRLMDWTNRNSDGWAYWAKPVTAATKLQRIVDGVYGWGADSENDVPFSTYRAALTPIKAFLTRQGVDHSVVFING